MESPQKVIDETKAWINKVVIGCNFCPFAAKVVKQNSIHFEVVEDLGADKLKTIFLNEMIRLDENKDIETSFLIFPNSYTDFNEYLKLVLEAEKLMAKNDYEGIYQLASFHPLYQFADSLGNDAANYTNRSVYPMLHLLREESIEKALENYESPENIPERNINFAREKGLTYMKMLRDSCLNS